MAMGCGKSLCLVLGQTFCRLRVFEGEKSFENPGPNLVHPSLQVVEMFMKSLADDFLDAGEGKIGTKLPKQFFGWRAVGAGRRAGNGVKRIARCQKTKVDGARKLAIEQKKLYDAFG